MFPYLSEEHSKFSHIDLVTKNGTAEDTKVSASKISYLSSFGIENLVCSQLGDASVDAVVSFHTLCTVHDQIKALKEIKRSESFNNQQTLTS
jgi:hypothetical protein